MENLTESCIDNKMSENDKSDVAVLANGEEKDSVDKTEVREETSNNEVEQGYTGKLDKYDPSLDILIALRKGRSCIKYLICNYVSYNNLSPQFKTFTTNLDSTIIPKNIHSALECPRWKNVFMEEMKAFENNKTWEICALPKGTKLWDANGCQRDEVVNRILRYVKMTPVKGLMFRKTDRMTMEAYIDLDWARSVVDRKSTFGYIVLLYGAIL